MKEKITYTCEICGKSYDTKEEALACEAKKTTPPKYNIGDIVETQFVIAQVDEIKTVGHDNVYVLSNPNIENDTGEYKEEEIFCVRMNKEQYAQLEPLSKIMSQAVTKFIQTQFKCKNLFVKATPHKSASVNIEAVCFF